MRQHLTAVGIAAMALLWASAALTLDPGPSVASAHGLHPVATELSVMEEAQLLLARELRSGFVRCDVSGLYTDGPVELTGPVHATVTAVEQGRVALLTTPAAGTVRLRRGDVEATLSWPSVGPGELRWCTSVVARELPVIDS